MPPMWRRGSRSATWRPMRAALTAVITPPAVPSYTTRSYAGPCLGDVCASTAAAQRNNRFRFIFLTIHLILNVEHCEEHMTLLRADEAKVEWNSEKKQWHVVISVGAEV